MRSRHTHLFLSLILLGGGLHACTNAYTRLSGTYRSPDEALLVDRIETSQRWNQSMLSTFDQLKQKAAGSAPRRELDDSYQEALRQGWEARRLLAAAVDVAKRLPNPPPIESQTWLDSVTRADASIAAVLDIVEPVISPALVDGGQIGSLTPLEQRLDALRDDIATTGQAGAALAAALGSAADGE